jgi:hypothetical protein
MQGAWAHERAYYRCRFPGEYADIQGRHPRSVNVRESAILAGLDRWLAGIFSPHGIDDTCTALAAASEPDPAIRARQDAHRKKLKDCDLSIKLTYHPEGTVEVEARPRVYSSECRRGDLNSHASHAAGHQAVLSCSPEQAFLVRGGCSCHSPSRSLPTRL